MATKRPAPSDGPSSSRPFHKRHRTNNAQPHKPVPANLGNKSFKKAHTVNDLKSNIRSLRRLLSGPKGAALPANVRVEKERALKTAEQDLAREEYAKKRNDIISRWHKVRFFDRQKAERRLKKARKALQKDEGSEELQQKVRDRENEVNYAIYYPLDQDYVPLFPSRRKKDGEEDAMPETEGGEVERQGDDAMWELVKKCGIEGTLKDLREGQLTKPDDDRLHEGLAAKQGKEPLDKKNSQNTEITGTETEEGLDEENESDNESGGGFFE